MNILPSDQGIPLLTEVIGPQATPEPASPAAKISPAARPSAPPQSTPASPPPAPMPARTAFSSPASPAPVATATVPAAAIPAATEAHAATPWKDSELGELEKDLRERITRQVLGRIDFVLDHRVRNSLTEVVDQAIDALAGEIKRGLHETLTDIVTRAVAQEISRLQSTKK